MSEHAKWESNKKGGGVFVTMSDSTPCFVAEALGATKEIKVKRAAFIALACNAHDDLLAACRAMEKLFFMCGSGVHAAGGVIDAINTARTQAKAAIAKAK